MLEFSCAGRLHPLQEADHRLVVLIPRPNSSRVALGSFPFIIVILLVPVVFALQLCNKPSRGMRNEMTLCPRRCFLVMKGLSPCSFKLSMHLADSEMITSRLRPRPEPLFLFCTTTSLRSATDMFAHSSLRPASANHFRKDFRVLWHL